LFTVVFILWVVQRTLFGNTRGMHIREQAILDVTAREAAILVPLAAAVLFIGLSPGPILSLLQGPIAGLIGLLK
jgi:NADH-quinone oxidoreductase subunit M